MTITSVINGVTILSDRFTTVTYTPTATADAKANHHSGLSEKNKHVVIGVVVGVGVPLLILIAVLIYIYCIKPKRTNFLNSEGKVVTAYTSGKVPKWWKRFLGKQTDEYVTESPDPGLNDPADLGLGRNNTVGRHNTDSHRKSHSNELMLEEEKYYDDDGNELNGRNY